MLTKSKILGIKKGMGKEDYRLPLIFGALSDRCRFKIFKLLTEKMSDVCVTDIAKIFGITVSAASQQLRILELSGLIHKERKGRSICYGAKSGDAVVKAIIKIIR